MYAVETLFDWNSSWSVNLKRQESLKKKKDEHILTFLNFCLKHIHVHLFANLLTLGLGIFFEYGLADGLCTVFLT